MYLFRPYQLSIPVALPFCHGRVRIPHVRRGCQHACLSRREGEGAAGAGIGPLERRLSLRGARILVLGAGIVALPDKWRPVVP